MASTTSATPYEIPCPLCGRLCDVRLARTGKPYFTCPACGLRCFVNSPAGQDRLAAMCSVKEREDGV